MFSAWFLISFLYSSSSHVSYRALYLFSFFSHVFLISFLYFFLISLISWFLISFLYFFCSHVSSRAPYLFSFLHFWTVPFTWFLHGFVLFHLICLLQGSLFILFITGMSLSTYFPFDFLFLSIIFLAVLFFFKCFFNGFLILSILSWLYYSGPHYYLHFFILLLFLSIIFLAALFLLTCSLNGFLFISIVSIFLLFLFTYFSHDSFFISILFITLLRLSTFVVVGLFLSKRSFISFHLFHLPICLLLPCTDIHKIASFLHLSSLILIVTTVHFR